MYTLSVIIIFMAFRREIGPIITRFLGSDLLSYYYVVIILVCALINTFVKF